MELLKMNKWEKELVGDTEKKKVVKQITEKVTDKTTGEIFHEINLEEAYISKEPDFIKVYLDNILTINNLPNGLQKTLNSLLKRMGYNNQIALNAYIKKEIAQELGLSSVQSLNNNINKLVKSKIMYRQGTGTYKMNAFLFGRGTWDNIKAIRLELIYEEGKLRQKSDFDYKDEEEQNILN